MGIYILVCRGEIGYPTVRVDVGAKPAVGTISCDIHKCNILILPMLPILYYQIGFFESISSILKAR